MSGKYTGLVTSDTTRAIIDVLLPGTARTNGFLRYPSRSAAARMRSAVSAFTRPGREKARDTVEGATPHSRATS